MYNEAYARAVLAERARARETSLFLDGLYRDRRTGVRHRRRRNSPAYLRGIPASLWRATMARPRRRDGDDDIRALADA